MRIQKSRNSRHRKREVSALEFQFIKEIIETNYSFSGQITMNSTITDDLGLDSLDLYAIVMEVEEKYDIEFAAETLERMETIEDLVKAIQEAVK